MKQQKITVAIGSQRHPVQVRAYPVEIEGFPTLYAHRLITRAGTVSKTGWTISEATTGLAVWQSWQSDLPSTRKNTIEQATKFLEYVGVEKFNRTLAESPKWLNSEVTK